MINSANKVTGTVYQNYSRISQYFNLKEENENLARENALLHSLLRDSYIHHGKVVVTQQDTTYKQKYTYFSAKVVNNTVFKRNNYLTLDKGTLNDVKPEMAVISATGIVGIVKDVSKEFCTVMSILHKDARISARIRKNNYFGSLTWDGLDYRLADLNDIPRHVKLQKGDTVVTSAYSSIFPEGVMIGTIEQFEVKEAANFYTIKVRFVTNYKNLTNVYLIENLLKQQQDTLEKATEEKALNEH